LDAARVAGLAVVLLWGAVGSAWGAPGDDALVASAGAAFRAKDYGRAARLIRQVLAQRPDDAYAHEFLATVYFLEGNMEAALGHWNRVGKPVVSSVALPAGLRTDGMLLDRAFRFAPGDVLRLDDYRTTEARVAALGVFGNPQLLLEGQDDGRFAVVLRGRERNGWGDGRLGALLGTLRGIGYQTVHPEYANAGGRAVNVTSLWRWDPQKRRGQAEVSGPFRRDVRYRYALGLDGRDERWQMRSGAGESFRLQRAAVRAGMHAVPSGNWRWSAMGEWSHREVGAREAGYQLKQTLRAERALWRAPERGFASWVEASAEAGRLWMGESSLFGRFESALHLRWHGVQMRAGAGRMAGRVAFDELFLVGLERDNDLWLRAHIGTREGRKGSAPMGRSYGLVNGEFDRRVFSNGWMTATLSPFADVGRVGDSGLLVDVGLQMKLRVLGVGFTVSYGKDLRSGRNAWYAMGAPGRRW
jgi:hypothetical protein